MGVKWNFSPGFFLPWSCCAPSSTGASGNPFPFPPLLPRGCGAQRERGGTDGRTRGGRAAVCGVNRGACFERDAWGRVLLAARALNYGQIFWRRLRTVQCSPERPSSRSERGAHSGAAAGTAVSAPAGSGGRNGAGEQLRKSLRNAVF